MGKTFDALLKRSSLKSYKFKPLVNLAHHRLAVLKNQRQARLNLVKSDVVEIVKLGFLDRALLRVEHVIKEQNMLDVFHMIERYLDLVLERFHMIEHDKFCPEELKEAISSLMYAASRCGEFPELQEIRAVFTLHYGKEFAARAIELRNNCGVNTTLIQKLSTRMPSLESRMSVLKQIADENGITLHIGESSVEKQAEAESAVSQVVSPKVEDDTTERYFGPGKGRKYENAADAAQAAFESAAYAAQAARAAVELSRGGSHDSEGSNSPFPMRRNSLEQRENTLLEDQTESEQVLDIEDDISSFKNVKDVDDVHIDDQETEASASLKKSMSISSDSTESMESDVMDGIPKHANPIDEMDQGDNYHLTDSEQEETNDKTEASNSQDMSMPEKTDEKTKVENSPVTSMPEETEDKTEAADSQYISMPEEHVEQAHELSWFRREWNSKKEKIKRPFSHRSRGIVSS